MSDLTTVPGPSSPLRGSSGKVVAVVVIAALYLLLNHTWAGRAIRAASVNESGALLVGVSVATIAVCP